MRSCLLRGPLAMNSRVQPKSLSTVSDLQKRCHNMRRWSRNGRGYRFYHRRRLSEAGPGTHPDVVLLENREHYIMTFSQKVMAALATGRRLRSILQCRVHKLCNTGGASEEGSLNTLSVFTRLCGTMAFRTPLSSQITNE